MKSFNQLMALMFFMFVGTSILLVAGVCAAEDINYYYYSGKGNNLASYMYKELILQDNDTATLSFSTRYDIEETKDFAMPFVSYDPKLKELHGFKLNGTQTDWTNKVLKLTPFSNSSYPKKYIGFYYETNISSTIRDGFYVDNIKITVNGLTIMDDDGTNESWIFGGFTRVPISPIISQPIDIQIEQDARGSITWIVTETSGMYKVLKDSTEVFSLTPYIIGEELNIPIDTSELRTLTYTIVVNDTSGNMVSDQVNITVQTQALPTINITSPDDGVTTTSGFITISGVVDGTGSIPTVTVNNKLVDIDLTGVYKGTFSESVSLKIGDNPINATVTDASGLIAYDLITVTRKRVSSGGGGGGGGGTSGEDVKNILVSETKREYVNKAKKASYNFDQEGNIIKYINFTGKTSSGRIAAKIDTLKDTSTLVDHAPPGKVYKNMGIYVGNLGWASPNNIENPTISFYVDKSWVNTYNIDISTIKLNRYIDGKWNPLETNLVYEDSDYLYFESKTPGFSQFAITGTEASVAQNKTEEVDIKQTVIVERKQPVTEQTQDEKDTGIPGFTLLIGITIILVVVQLMRRK